MARLLDLPGELLAEVVSEWLCGEEEPFVAALSRLDVAMCSRGLRDAWMRQLQLFRISHNVAAFSSYFMPSPEYLSWAVTRQVEVPFVHVNPACVDVLMQVAAAGQLVKCKSAAIHSFGRLDSAQDIALLVQAFAGVEQLTFSLRHPTLARQAMAALAAYPPTQLRNFTLNSREGVIPTHVLVSLIEHLGPRLESLSIPSNGDTVVPAALAAHCTKLRSLQIDAGGLAADVLFDLFAFQQNHLRDVEIENWGVVPTDALVAQLVLALPQLERLVWEPWEFDNDNPRDEGEGGITWRALQHALDHRPRLGNFACQQFDYRRTHRFSDSDTCTFQIDLVSDDSLEGALRMMALAPAPVSGVNLLEISTTATRCADASVCAAWAAFLQCHGTSVRCLTLHYQSQFWGDEDPQRYFPAMSMLQACPQLVEVQIFNRPRSSAEPFFESGAQRVMMHDLRRLTFYNDAATDDAALDIFLTSVPQLRALSLVSSTKERLTDRCLDHIYRRCPALRRLQFDRTMFCEDLLSAFKEARPQCQLDPLDLQ